MAQFTPQTLARLLTNVEREVLVEALEIAEMVHLLPARHLQVIEDLEGNWNTLFNVWLGGVVSDAGSTVSRYQRSFEALPKPENPFWRPSGILAIDGALFSAKLATDYFNPNGLIAGLIARVDQVISDIAGIPTDHPEFPKHPPQEHEDATNIYDLDQIKIHTDHALDDMDFITAHSQWELGSNAPSMIESFRLIRQRIGNISEGMFHDLWNVRLHRDRFIDDMLGDTFIEDIYH